MKKDTEEVLNRELATILYRAKQIQEELDKLHSKNRLLKKKEIEAEPCTCSHKRALHGQTISFNYTEGPCIECNCKHFISN